MTILSIAAILFFASHLLQHLYLGDPANALWACHVASLLIGVGGLAGRPAIVGVGVLWLIIGIPLWFYHLAVGGPLVPTSILTHFGGIAVGGILLFQLGPVNGIWWRATIGLACLVGITRLLTSRSQNINLAFDVHGRSETPVLQHSLYLLAIALVITLVFVIAEYVLHRVLPTHEIFLNRQSD